MFLPQEAQREEDTVAIATRGLWLLLRALFLSLFFQDIRGLSFLGQALLAAASIVT